MYSQFWDWNMIYQSEICTVFAKYYMQCSFFNLQRCATANHEEFFNVGCFHEGATPPGSCDRYFCEEVPPDCIISEDV